MAAAGMFDFTCSHEVAHQWWQGLVGSDPRRAPWVDEALAQYSAVLVTEDAKGKAAADQAMSTFVALNYHGMRMAAFPTGKGPGRAAGTASRLRTPGWGSGRRRSSSVRRGERWADVGFMRASGSD